MNALSDARLRIGFTCLLTPLIKKGCVPVMIQGDVVIFWVHHGS